MFYTIIRNSPVLLPILFLSTLVDDMLCVLFYGMLLNSVRFYSALFYFVLICCAIISYSILHDSVLVYATLFYSVLLFSAIFCYLTLFYFNILFCWLTLFCATLFSSMVVYYITCYRVYSILFTPF